MLIVLLQPFDSLVEGESKLRKPARIGNFGAHLVPASAEHLFLRLYCLCE